MFAVVWVNRAFTSDGEGGELDVSVGADGTNLFALPSRAWQLSVLCVVRTVHWTFCVVPCCVSVLSVRPLTPGGFGGQFMIWLWCYNTIGLQWCCSSSLTLLAPPTGPLLPTLPLLLCLLGSAPCSRQAMYGWPMRRWRPWQPLPKRSVPCVLYHPPFSFSVSLVCGRVEMCVVADGEGMRPLTPFLVCEPLNTNLKTGF